MNQSLQNRLFIGLRTKSVFQGCLAGLILIAGLHLFSGCAAMQQKLYEKGMAAELAKSEFHERSLTIGQDTIAYLERAGSRPDGETIVLLHGFAADKSNWIRFARYLPSRYHVLAPDLPGHGDSSHRKDRSYAVPALAGDFAKIVKAFGLSRFHLAGNSMGGYISLLHAHDHPAQVMSLALFDAAGVVPPNPSEFQKLLDKGRNPLVVTSRADFDKMMDFVFFHQPFLPWPAYAVIARDYVARARFNQKLWQDVSASLKDLSPILPDLSLPVLILWGANDRVIDVSSVPVFKSHLPQAQTAIMMNCGHAPMVERPEEAAGHYVRFLRDNADHL